MRPASQINNASRVLLNNNKAGHLSNRHDLFIHIKEIRGFNNAFLELKKYVDTVDGINAGMIDMILKKTKNYQESKKLIEFARENSIPVDEGNLHYIIECCCVNYLELSKLLDMFEKAKVIPKRETCNIIINKLCNNLPEVFRFLTDYQASYDLESDSYTMTALLKKCTYTDDFLECLNRLDKLKIPSTFDSMDIDNFRVLLHLPYKDFESITKVLTHPLVQPLLENCEPKYLNAFIKNNTEELIENFTKCNTLLNIFRDIPNALDAITLTSVAFIALKAKQSLNSFMKVFATKKMLIDGAAVAALYEFKKESGFKENFEFISRLRKTFTFDNAASNVALSRLSQTAAGNIEQVQQAIEIFIENSHQIILDSLTIGLILNTGNNLEECLLLLNMLHKYFKDFLPLDKSALNTLFGKCHDEAEFVQITKKYAGVYLTAVEKMLKHEDYIMPISIDAETMGVFLQIYFIFANEDNKSLLMEKLYLKSKFNSRTDVGGFMEYNFHNLETLFANLPECSSVIQMKNANLRNLTDKFTIRYEFAISLIEWLLHNTKHDSIGIVTGFNSGTTLKTKISRFLEYHQYDFCESNYAEGTLIVKLRHAVEKILEDKPIDEALDVKQTKDSVHKKRHKKRNKQIAQEERVEVQARVDPEIAQQFHQQAEQEDNNSNFQWIWENLNKIFAWRPW